MHIVKIPITAKTFFDLGTAAFIQPASNLYILLIRGRKTESLFR